MNGIANYVKFCFRKTMAAKRSKMRTTLLWVLALLSLVAAGVIFWTSLKEAAEYSVPSAPYSTGDPVWGYRCEAEICLKTQVSPMHPAENLSALSVCKQQCGGHGNLWPKPNGFMIIGNKLSAIDVKSISASHPNLESYLLADWLLEVDPETYKTLNAAFQLFLSKQQLKAKILRSGSGNSSVPLRVHLVVYYPDSTVLELDTDESYQLKIDYIGNSVRATISSKNFFGARHGLETLDQLIVVDNLHHEILIPNSVNISDRPSYPYRGVLIDTSRSFITIDALKRTIDAMGASKLNTLHWHITDSQSFPFESKSYPELTRLGAYSEKEIYSEEEISELVEYARVRGVRIVPELDAPAHVGEGWEFAPGTVVCFKANPWRKFCAEPPCGQLDPTNEQIYEILGGIYKDMIRTFNPSFFHMGGDEVNFQCWNTSQAIQQWFNARNLSNSTDNSFHELWNHFQTKALEKLYTANGGRKVPAIIWTSSMTNSRDVMRYFDPSKYIIQVWTRGDDNTIRYLADHNYKMIFSNYDALYLDCGYGSWIGTQSNNWCSPYIGWQKIYDNNPRDLMRNLGISSARLLSLALGAEAALWSEQTDSKSVDSKIWPRAAALAERLWSDPDSNSEAAKSRFLEHRERLVNLGILADSIQPQWCLYNDGYCEI